MVISLQNVVKSIKISWKSWIVNNRSISTSTSGGSRKLMIMTFALFITFSSLSPILGTSLMFIMRPGVQTAEELADWNSNTNRPFNPYAAMIKQGMVSKEDTFNLFPNNIVGAMFMQTYTGLEAKDPNNITLGYKPVTKNQFTVNFMGLCVFATMLGVAILCLGDQINTNGTYLLDGIGGHTVSYTRSANLATRVVQHNHDDWIFYPVVYHTLWVAFGTDSSAVTLPVTIKTMEDNVKLPERVTRFVLPLGVNVHMNGMAMYYPMVVLFVAQMHLVDIGVQHMIVLIFMTLVMSVAIPAIGSGGAVIIIFASFCAALGIENPLDVLVYVSVGDLLVYV
ncbi:unnamed protein product [Medioppia subpectinata]|uniref:Amino acid transporter n=1 Tax=Medioppia subpectinata TaxID=1979941 RepID=A0A7R9L3F2_9ACAR|nr:unnamed protein product [Medioppia subpectinata]CAG2113613.1 unnamed protein product [Medioppia subpectinata]